MYAVLWMIGTFPDLVFRYSVYIPKLLEDAGISKTINDDILGRRLMI